MPDFINQLPKLNFVGMDDTQQQWTNQLTDTINALLGFSGEIPLQNHIRMNGFRVKQIGAPVESTDAVSHGVAQKTYSASVLKPQLQSGGSQPLDTYRILNSSSQREISSGYLNDLMSAPPNANNLFPTLTTIGANVQVSIPAGLFTWADSSFVNTQARTDLLSKPAQFAIATIACVGNVVTVTCAATGLVAGQVATITGVTPASFNGTFVLTSSTGGGTTLTYQLDLGTVSGAGGNVQINGVYYYSLKKRLTALSLHGAFSGDTLQNRIQACFDGSQIVAVVTITNSGGQIALSGGGGSAIVGSPTAGSFF